MCLIRTISEHTYLNRVSLFSVTCWVVTVYYMMFGWGLENGRLAWRAGFQNGGARGKMSHAVAVEPWAMSHSCDSWRSWAKIVFVRWPQVWVRCFYNFWLKWTKAVFMMFYCCLTYPTQWINMPHLWGKLSQMHCGILSQISYKLWEI